MSNNEEQVKNQEGENTLDELRIRNFELMLSKRVLVEKMPIDEVIREFENELPIESQSELMTFYEDLKEGFFDEDDNDKRKQAKADKMKKMVIKQGETMMTVFKDSRFKINDKPMSNKKYAKVRTVEMIGELLSEKDLKIEDLKKIARISFDINGLKAVNDLTGSHEKGDAYLALMAEVLSGEKATKWLSERGITAIITADGGDEFGMILRSDTEIDSKVVFDEFVEGIVKNELWESEKTKDILDFNDEAVIIAYAGIDKNAWSLKSPEEKEIILEQIKKDIPEGYSFRAAVSAGVTTVYESMAYVNINKSDSFEKFKNEAMGKMFDFSDKEMQADKVKFKMNLAQSEDSCENFLLKVYSRTVSEKELRNTIELYEIFLNNLKAAVRDDATSAIPRLINDLEKQIEDLKQRSSVGKK